MSDKNQSARHSRKAAPASLTRGVAQGLAVMLAASLALLLLFTAIVYSTSDPGKLTDVAALAALYIACFAGGMTAVLSCGGEMSAGLICGGIFWLLLLLVSLMIPGSTSWPSVGLHSVCLAFAAAGTFAATSLSARKRRAGKRRRAR